MNNFNKYKQDIYSFYLRNLDFLEKVVLYDCFYFLDKFNSLKEMGNRSYIAKLFSSYLTNKYFIGIEGRGDEESLIDLLKNEEVSEFLMDLINYFDFISEKNNIERINYYKDKINKDLYKF